MVRYAHILNGEIDRVGLPGTGTLSDGRPVSGYNNLPEEILLEEGWLPVEEDPVPSYDPNTHKAIPGSFVVENDRVRQTWIIEEAESQPLSPEEELAIARAAFVSAVENSTTIEDLKAALVGESGPGAESRRRNPTKA